MKIAVKDTYCNLAACNRNANLMLIKKTYMRLREKLFLIITLLFSLPAFAEAGPPAKDTAFLPCLTLAGKRLDEAFSLMEKHYYKKNETRWDELKAAAKEKLTSAGSCEEAMKTIDWCFAQLGEPHSYIMPASRAAVYNNDQKNLPAPPTMFQVMGELKRNTYEEKGIAYLSLPWVNTNDSAICTRVADSIQGVIASLDQKNVNKWIIDLRNNRGGNCWPMIAGMGPLIGEGVLGYFVSGNEKVPISYREGAAMHGRYTRCRVSKTPYKLSSAKKWIIVLTGPSTSSSGEIMALAFKGREQTYIYGQPTAGLTTANTTYNLSDNSMLVLTVCREADRNGKLIEGSIVPDQLFPPAAESTDPALDAAIMWLDIL